MPLLPRPVLLALLFLSSLCHLPIVLSQVLAYEALITGVYPSVGSTAGGTRVTIVGSGFLRAGTSGSTTVTIGGQTCAEVPYYTTDSTFICDTPPGSGTEPLQMTLLGTGYGQYAVCQYTQNTGCNFVYSISSTPNLDLIYTPAVMAGQQLVYSGFLYGNYYSQYLNRIGGALCNLAPSFNTSLDNAGIGGSMYGDVTQQCTVSDQAAGRYLFSINILPAPDATTGMQLPFPVVGYGNGTSNTMNFKVDDTTGAIYNVVQLPVVTGLSVKLGASTGGQLVTITGTSFSTDCTALQVTIGWSLATVVSCSLDSIVVLTTPTTGSNVRETAAAALGTYGGTGYAYGVGSTGYVWYYQNVPSLALLGLQQQTALYGEQSMAGILIVPYTASYQFLLTSRDTASFSLSNSTVPAFQKTILSFGAGVGGGDIYFANAAIQQSAWITLQANTPYYWSATLNTFLFSVAVRIHNPSHTGSSLNTPFLPTDTSSERMYESFPTILYITIAPTVVREVQTITITGATGGYFQLTANGIAGEVPFPSSTPNDPATLAGIQAAADANSGCYIASVVAAGAFATATQSLASGVAFSVTFECPTTAPRALMSVQNINLTTSGTLSFTVTRTQNPSVALGGSFRAGFTAPGASTVWGSLITYGTTITTAMSTAAAAAQQTVDIILRDSDYLHGESQEIGDGFFYYVQVRSPLGDTSGFWTFDHSELTGTSPAITVSVIQQGSLDRFYNPIPADWTSITADQNQVTVSVDGLRSVCATGANGANIQSWLQTTVPSVADCQFLQDTSLVPTITAISASSVGAGTLLTLTGTGFDKTAANNIVSFTPTFTAYTSFPTVAATTTTAASLVFQVPHLSAGQYRVSVQVITVGRTDPNAAPVYLTFTATYNTPNALTLTGSVAGGALLIVTGSGFHIPQLLSFSGNDSFVETANYSALGGDSVQIGGNTCVLEDVSFTMLICRVPAPIPQAASTAAITINGATLGTYTYSTSATPQVTSVSPAQVSAAVTTIVTITGSGFTVPASYPSFFFSVDSDNPYNFTAVGHATTYDNTLFAEFAVHLNSLSCQVLTASATQITCQLTRSPPNPLNTQLTVAPTVYVMGQGYAQIGESTVELALQVNSVSPTIGSLQGGQYVTITGAGFVSQSTTSVTIDILTNKQLSDYPSMSTQSVTSHAMRVMSLAEGTVPEAQRFFPMQVEQAAPHLLKKRPTTAEDTLDAVMQAMHNRHHKQATKLSSNSRTFHSMQASNFEWTGLSVPCAITSISYGQIVCFTSSTGLRPSNFTGTGYTSIVGIVHVSINEIESLCATSDPSQSCLYAFDVNHTPTITSITPSSGGAGTVVTIAGSQLTDTLQTVLIGYDACTNVQQTASQITCTVSGNTAATVPVQVLFSSVGFAANTSLLTFTHTLHITSLSQTSGSYGGGTTVTLTGTGFSSVATDNNFTIGGLPGIVVSSTNTALVITTPPATLSKTDTTAALVLTVAGYYYAAYTYPNINTASVYPVLGDENPAMISSTTTSSSFTYTTSLTPTLGSVKPQTGSSGTVITVSGSGFTSATTVEVGGVACTPITGQTSTSLSCTVQNTPAGTYPVNVIIPSQGLAYVATANVTLTSFTASLAVTGVTPLSSSYGGGVSITLTGSGFGTLANQTIVSICNTNCSVVSSTYNKVVCTTDALSTLDRIQKYGPPLVTIAQPYGGASLIGYLGATVPLSQLANLNDDNPQTGVQADSSSMNTGWVGMDMGPSTLLALTQVRWYAPYGQAQSVTAGAVFQSSNDGSTWTTLFTVSAYPTEGWNYVSIVSQTAGTTVASVTSAHRYFRYVPPANVLLAMQEIEWQGYRVASVSNSVTGNDVTQCPVTVTVVAQDPLESLQANGAKYTNAVLPTTYTVGYTLAGTPTISNISPNNGSSLGGTSITFTGAGFTSTAATTEVALSGYPCTVTSVSSTQVVCTSTARSFIGMSPTGTQISLVVGTVGRALLVQQGGITGVPLVNPTVPLFRYLDRWSAINTWAYDEPPLAGDTVIIPQGQTILMDVAPPLLFVLLVQGVLVWDNQDGLTLDATYIWVNGGTFEIGTEQTPFTQNATITLHGDRYSTIELPYIGSKCLAVDGVGMGIFGTTYAPYARYGTDANGGARSDYYDNMNGIGVLDIHGLPRARVWTKVTPGTYTAGTTTIHTDEVVDWVKGEILVFTDSSRAHSVEEVVVLSLGADGKTITLASPLTLTHTSERYTIQGHDVDMRAQIAILSRNIVIQGDSVSQAQQYGSHVMMMAGSIMRLENIETRHCGQSFNLGRYCLHFHMAGDVSMSYVKSNSIHDGYQRATTTHGVEYATVFNEVAYNVKGHNFFVEDGAERQNTFDGNLAINVQQLTTMLQSDLMPAGFWTSTPANNWINNAVSGSSNAGFWFELPQHPGGPSVTNSICPGMLPVGQFYNNTFSHGSVGVQVYAQLTPSLNPCSVNPIATPAASTLELTTVYRVGQGYMLKHIGPDVQILNSVMVECGSGIDWSNIDGGYIGARDNVVNSLVVGSVVPGNFYPVNGFWLPQTEYVRVTNVSFVNQPAVALLLCKQCDTVAQMNQGGFTLFTKGLQFINTPIRFRPWYPYKEILFDYDGSLTGIAGGSLTPYYAFNVNPHCTAMNATYGGIVCDSSVRVRKLSIMYPLPEAIWSAQLIVTTFDSTGKQMGVDVVPYHTYDFSGWLVNVVTSYTYQFNFSVGGLAVDFDMLVFRYSEPSIVNYNLISAQQEWTLVKLPYQTYRWEFEADYPGNPLIGLAVQSSYGSVAVPWNNYTGIASCAPTWNQPFGTGCTDRQHLLYQVILNTQGNASLGTNMYQALIQSLECPYGGCGETPPPVISSTYSLWSQAATWTALNLSVPVAGASVTIPPTAWIVFDLAGAPAYDEIAIQGRLSFADTADLELIATRIFVTGDFEIGTAAAPFQHKATITLTGDQTSPILVVDNSQQSTVSNKVLAVFGNASFHGQPIVNTWTTLAATAAVGATSFTVTDSISDWTVGATIVVSSTEYDSTQREQVLITAISGNTITFTPKLNHTHYAGNIDYSATNNVVFAAKVGLLDRSIVVRGSMTALDLADTWGAHIVVSEIPSLKATTSYLPVGRLDFTYVQLDHVGQGVTAPAVLLHYFVGDDNPTNEYGVTYWGSHTQGTDVASAMANTMTSMVGCSFSNVYAQGLIVEGALNVILQDNVFDTTYGNAIKMDAAATNSIVTGNLVINALRAPTQIADNHHPISALYILALPLVFTDNVVAGAADSALTFNPPACGPMSTTLFSFESHSSPMGVWMLPGLTQGGCVQLSNVKVWKHSFIAVYTVDQDYNLILTQSVIADSHEGLHFAGFSNTVGQAVEVVDSILFGTTATSSCSQSLTCSGVATSWDLLGTSTECNSAFGPEYRHVGIVGSTYYGRGRTCQIDGKASFGAAGDWSCDPLNQVVYSCALPLDQRYGLPPTNYGSMYISNVTFAHWTANECNGMRSAAIAYNPASETFSPEIWASSITWYKSDVAAYLNLALTNGSGNCLDGCDGYDMFVITDVDGTLLADTAGVAAGNVVVTAGSRVVTNNPACTYQNAWNGYICVQQPWRQIIIGLPGATDRLNPVYETTQVSSSLNVTGFSVGPIDDDCSLMMYFPYIPFLALAGAQTNLVPTGNMPTAAEIIVHSSSASDVFLLTFFYTQPMQMIAYNNGVLGNQLTTRIPTIADPPGTFAFSPQARLAYVVVSGGYSNYFTLEASGLISVTMALAVDFATFDGANVVYYMSQLLSIDPTTIKVADVHAGSTIASYYISGSPNVTSNATLNADYLNGVATNLVQVVQSGLFTEKTGYAVVSMTVTPPAVNGSSGAPVTVSSGGTTLTTAETAGIATGVIVGVVIAVIVVLLFAACGGVYVVRQRRLAAASKSVYSAKEAIELPQQEKLADKMKAKRPLPPIVARKESLPSATLGQSQSSYPPESSPSAAPLSSNAVSRRESFATLNLDAPIEDDGKRYVCIEAYHPRFPQELELQVGDVLTQATLASESWYVATNERTGERGAVLKGHVTLMKPKPQFAPAAFVPSDTPATPFSLSSSPPLPAALTTSTDINVTRHTYVPTDDNNTIESSAVFYPPAARAPVINLDRWERSKSRNSLKPGGLGDTLTMAEPTTPTPSSPYPLRDSPSPRPVASDEEKEEATQERSRNSGVHRRVLSMERRWSGGNNQ